MQNTKQQFIEFALEADVLRFGEFKTKAGRLSPYFFNAVRVLIVSVPFMPKRSLLPGKLAVSTST